MTAVRNLSMHTISSIVSITAFFLGLLPVSASLAAKTGVQGQTAPVAHQYRYTARTQDALKQSGRVRAGSLRWACRGKACTITGPWPVPGVSACNTLAKRVGRIVEYGHPGRKLNNRQLARCNQGLAVVIPKKPKPLPPARIQSAVATPAAKTAGNKTPIAVPKFRPSPVAVPHPAVTKSSVVAASAGKPRHLPQPQRQPMSRLPLPTTRLPKYRRPFANSVGPASSIRPFPAQATRIPVQHRFGSKTAQLKNKTDAQALISANLLKINGHTGPVVNVAEGASVEASWEGSATFVQYLGETLSRRWLVVSERWLAADSCNVADTSDLPDASGISGDGLQGASVSRVIGGLTPGTTYHVKLCIETFAPPGFTPTTRTRTWRHESQQITLNFGESTFGPDGSAWLSLIPTGRAPDLVVEGVQRSLDPGGGEGQLFIRFRDALGTGHSHNYYDGELAARRRSGLPFGPKDIYPFHYMVFVDGTRVPQAGGTSYLPRSGRQYVVTEHYWLPPDGRPHRIRVVAIPDSNDFNTHNNVLADTLSRPPVRVQVSAYGIERMQVVYDGDAHSRGELVSLGATLTIDVNWFQDGSLVSAGNFAQRFIDAHGRHGGTIQNLTTRVLRGTNVDYITINDGDILAVAFYSTMRIETTSDKRVRIEFNTVEDDSPEADSINSYYRLAPIDLATMPLGNDCYGENQIPLAGIPRSRMVYPFDNLDGALIKPISGWLCVTRIPAS